MRRSRRIAVAAATALALWLGSHSALAQKSGGVLKMPDFASPASCRSTRTQRRCTALSRGMRGGAITFNKRSRGSAPRVRVS